MMSHKTALALAFSILILLTLGSAERSGAANRYVCPTCEYTTIQDAIDAASFLDDVIVGTPNRSSAEVYVENITMKNGVDVISEGNATTVTYTDPWYVGPATTSLRRTTRTIIDGGGTGPVVSFNESITFPTVLDGFIVQNIGYLVTTLTPLISVRGCSPTIRNNIIRDENGPERSGGIGIEGRYDAVEILARPTIEKNLIHKISGAGIGNGAYSAATIQDNEIWDCRGDHGVGIGMRKDTAPTILNNDILRNDKAGIGSWQKEEPYAERPYLWRLPGYDLTIKGNNLHDNQAGVRIQGNMEKGSMDALVIIGGSTAAEGNIMDDNSMVGIRIEGMGGSVIENNNISDSARIGIYVNNLGLMNPPHRGFTRIRYNQVHDHRFHCINIAGVDEVTIYGNDLSSDGGRTGINIGNYSATYPKPIIIQRNNVYGASRAGIRLKDAVRHSRYQYVSENNVYQNTKAGILIRADASSSYTADIVKNVIYNNNRGGIHSHYTYPSRNSTANIRQNKVYNNGSYGYYGGIDLRHLAGTIDNNLIYRNQAAGIRFGTEIGRLKNNTVAANGVTRGGGIVYTDNYGEEVTSPPTGDPPADTLIKNNVVAWNLKTGIRACGCDRDYNLVYANHDTGETDCGWPDSPIMSCINKQFAGCGAHFDFSQSPPIVLNGENDVIGNPLFIDMPNDDYHLDDASPGKQYPGDDGTERGCYGGTYPIHNLIDVDFNTGNTPAGGEYVMFDLGASYTVTHVRIYRGSGPATSWSIYVGSNSGGCSDTWGTYVGSASLNSNGWKEINVTNWTGRYIKLECTSHTSVPENNVAEFDYLRSQDSSLYWHKPSIVVAGCTDMNG